MEMIQIEKAHNIDELISVLPANTIIVENFIKAWSIINDPIYKKILCSISGGSDSDIMLDICWRCDKDNKITYVWFDTGLEYQATKDHLLYLEKKYNIEILRYKAIKPIPTSCRQYGLPFVSKQVSDFVQRLQRHNFQWENEDFETLYNRYPKCKSALSWWCNTKKSIAFNIDYNKWLKEFLISTHPTFSISDKCCKYAKKDVSKKLIQEGNYDLQLIGIRKAEGGGYAL